MRRRPCLLDALRKHLGLTGSKKGCDQGTCDACTMWVDGRRVLVLRWPFGLTTGSPDESAPCNCQ
jgi:aerobic-type carbon monoxide dehydrogenase small subunit (CoxS/CutS family)